LHNRNSIERHDFIAQKEIGRDQKSRSEKMVNRLHDLRSSNPDVEASAVVSADGLIVASDLPSGVEEDRVAAMSAAMLSLGDRIATELRRGVLDQVYIHGEKCFFQPLVLRRAERRIPIVGCVAARWRRERVRV
jgi:predicted regulator of Ras-like GTPase activity (Roadblock/LC7/MglB family)